ncbi:TIGR00255 family protein [Oryzisolibacter propanilivorax]|uniref:TIGR00255 family protein n=1 Tax=Oryzisolibacter propanilivorax TaxID=1527607 RepID=A0A1G9RAG4_9BURK|nr:YicC/YloC family endoribonuclease [Oryzisolibacter propanilivorax]SDM20218.1 TIGR00255 family protein [Oryzisolibacter propanilivorax]
MAVYSMTGYASAQCEVPGAMAAAPTGARRLGLELRSVNSRFLDLTLRLSDELRAHEPALRALLTAGLKRGKVELRAYVDQADGAGLAQPPEALLQRLAQVQDAVRVHLPQAAPLSVADALRLAASGSAQQQDLGPQLLELARQALQELRAAREREGARLVATLHERLQGLRTLAQQAAPLIPALVEQQRQRFMERWREAMQLAEGAAVPEAAQERALSEATAFAIRIDVAEELTRLAAHVEEIARLLDQGGEVGKRLDFLIQELHREANTLGSKSATMELTRIGVDMKVLIEQMREQVQNLE